MKTTPNAANVASSFAGRSANPAETRYRAREIGVGYGKSSGYAPARSFVSNRGFQTVRCR